MGDGSSYGINLLSIVKNSANIISSKLSSYATYFGGVSIGDSYLCSVKKKVGKISDGTAARQSGERQVGFVVTAKGTGLSADVLKLMNVRIYNEGKQVAADVTTAAVAAKLIGSQNSHKIRYSINVPASTVCNMKCSFLADSDQNAIKQWGPDNDLDGIYKEGEGDLDEEITG